MVYRHIVFTDDYGLFHADGFKELFRALKAAGYRLGFIATELTAEYEKYDSFWELYHCFDCILNEPGDGDRDQELDGDLLKKYMRRFEVDKKDILYIGSSIYDMESAFRVGVDCGLALWRCEKPKHTWATYYFTNPYDMWNQITRNQDPFEGIEWLSMAMELQYIAQTGLGYTHDMFDKERFERIREISVQAMAIGTGLPIRHIKDVFCNETGFQTPKLDSRGVVFQEDKILLVRESNGLWSLPGGWVDVNQSISSNTVKEVREEAGLDVVPVRLIALHDRNQHNTPVYAYGICKAFVLCEVISGKFEKNNETVASGYFGLEELPPLAEDKTTKDQVRMCFEAHQKKQWIPVVD